MVNYQLLMRFVKGNNNANKVVFLVLHPVVVLILNQKLKVYDIHSSASKSHLFHREFNKTEVKIRQKNEKNKAITVFFPLTLGIKITIFRVRLKRKKRNKIQLKMEMEN